MSCGRCRGWGVDTHVQPPAPVVAKLAAGDAKGEAKGDVKAGKGGGGGGECGVANPEGLHANISGRWIRSYGWKNGGSCPRLQEA